MSAGGNSLLAARLADKANLAGETGFMTHSPFLSPAEQEIAPKIAQKAGVFLVLDGGFTNAERKAAFFLPTESQCVRAENGFPIRALHIAPKGKAFVQRRPTHRDVLGAVLALGLSREVVGDILMTEEGAFLLAFADAAAFIQTELSQVGSMPVSVIPAVLDEIPQAENAGRSVAGTVSSLRLDGLLAEAYNLSREDAKKLVLAGFVQINHKPAAKPDRLAAQGDLVSVRGKGRFLLAQVGSKTRKGRLHVVLTVMS